MTRRFALRTDRAVVADAIRPVDIVVDDGEIARITARGECEETTDVIDVGDDVVMPGLVDPHVHVNEPGRTHWEGFETATRAACAGGITTIVDMPLNSSPVTTTVEALERKLDAADGKLWIDCGFYGGLVPDSKNAIEPLVDAGVLGVKAFLCHSGIDEFPASGPRELKAAMPVLADAERPLLVHSELVDDVDTTGADPTSYTDYATGRPQRWEIRAIELLVEHCRNTGCPVHVVHLAASRAVPLLRSARAEGLPISVETCPHYLYFAAEELPDGDPRYKCAPPVRDAENRNALCEALFAGDIDLVATDHSPSPPEMKELDTGDLQRAWGGIASIQLLLPALWTAVRDHGATPVDVARWTSSQPARLIGLQDRLGELAAGRPANLVVWDPDASFEVDADELYHRHPVTPYDGEELFGEVKATYLRGERVFDGRDVGEKPRGSKVLRD